MRQRVLVGLLFACFMVPVVVDAQAEAPSASTTLAVLAYHPYPDVDRPGLPSDPFGFAAVFDGEGTGRDWMSATYGAYWYPTARFDGVRESNYAQDSQVGNMREFYDAYREHVRARAALGAPFTLRVNASPGWDAEGSGRIDVTISNATRELASGHLVLRIVLFEDPVVFDGGNGVTTHRFVARAMLPPERVDVIPGQTTRVARSFEWPDALADRARAGVVAYVYNADETARNLAAGEVLQVATYRFAQAQPTIQREKGVLLEFATATWCDACVYGDGAVDLLAREFGLQSAPGQPGAQGTWTYFQAPSLARALAVAAAGATLAWIVSRSGGRERA